MMIVPKSHANIAIYPESEVEAFFIREFLSIWRASRGSIEISDGIYGDNPTASATIIPSFTPTLEVANFIKKP